MRTIQSAAYGSLELSDDQIYSFENEIPGVPGIHEYGLMALDDTPFYVLHALEEDVSFILLPAYQAVENYGFKLTEEVVSVLKLESPEDVGVMLVVNIQNNELFVNLMAPMLFAPRSQRGYQYIIKDQDMPIRYPLNQKEEA